MSRSRARFIANFASLFAKFQVLRHLLRHRYGFVEQAVKRYDPVDQRTTLSA